MSCDMQLLPNGSVYWCARCLRPWGSVHVGGFIALTTAPAPNRSWACFDSCNAKNVVLNSTNNNYSVWCNGTVKGDINLDLMWHPHVNASVD